MAINSWHGIGNLGRDPEVRYMQDGTCVCTFSIAVSAKVKGEKETMWMNVVAFGKLGEICAEYLTKGKQVYIEGRLAIEQYEKDGATKTAVKVIANKMQMLGGAASSAPTADTAAPADVPIDDDVDMIPF